MMTENSDSFETVAEAREIPSSPKTTGKQSNMEDGVTSQGVMANPTTFAIRNFANNNPDLQQITTATAAKIDSLKKWTVNTYKSTKHLCLEHIGKIDKTVDSELEGRIDALRELRKAYREMLSTAQHFTNYLALANNMQRAMANDFCELATKEIGISKEMNMQSELFALIAQNNEPLHRNLALFISSLQTLTDNTIEDTFLTIENHDQARLEFDISRQELKMARESAAELVAELEGECQKRKEKYEQMKGDVQTKLVLLEENRCKVMRKQIVALQNAFAACFSGNAQVVERAIGDLAKMGLMTSHDSLPPNSLAHSGDVHSFLEK